MFPYTFILVLLAFAAASDDMKNTKRSISSVSLPPWNSFLGHPWPSLYSLQPNPLVHGSLYPLSTGYLGKGMHFGWVGPSATHDIGAAIAAAKEATAAAALAQQKVQVAREQVAIQERVAAAKEAAAHAAIQRSEAAAQIAAAIQKTEALAAATAAVHKSAAASAAAAHAAGYFSSGPWIHSKSGFNNWG